MVDFKFYSKCLGCRKTKFFIRKRSLKISVGTVTSQDLMCSKCFRNLAAKINPK